MDGTITRYAVQFYQAPYLPASVPIYHSTMCPRSSYQFCVVSYYIKLVTTSWTHSIIDQWRRLEPRRYIVISTATTGIEIMKNASSKPYSQDEDGSMNIEHWTPHVNSVNSHSKKSSTNLLIRIRQDISGLCNRILLYYFFFP